MTQEFKKFPIYTLKIDIKKSPEDKSKNVVYHRMLWEKELTLEKKTEVIEHNINLLKEKYGQNIEITKVSLELTEWDTWNLTWFCHETIRQEGLTDRDYLISFEEFVRRKENDPNIEPELRRGQLMGADERWRWHGETRDDKAPCNCEHCFTLGRVRINH